MCHVTLGTKKRLFWLWKQPSTNYRRWIWAWFRTIALIVTNKAKLFRFTFFSLKTVWNGIYAFSHWYLKAFISQDAQNYPYLYLYISIIWSNVMLISFHPFTISGCSEKSKWILKPHSLILDNSCDCINANGIKM